MNDKWKGIIGSVAPTIASMFGSPLAGVATKVALDALGISPSASVDEIEERVANLTPADLRAIKDAEIQFKKDMKELDIKADGLVLADKQDARAMRMAKDDITVDIIAYSVILAWVSINSYILYAGLPDNLAEPVLYRILGTLDAAVVLVLSFFFGSSRGAEKVTGGSNGK